MLLILEPEMERRISAQAKRRGVPEAELACELIEASLEDLEDIQVAVERLGKPLSPPSSAEARTALGLDEQWHRLARLPHA